MSDAVKKWGPGGLPGAYGRLVKSPKLRKTEKGVWMRNRLRQETVNTTFRKDMVSERGSVCANCGSDEYIEYHHIVPIFLGGTNKMSNIVPLCSKCHKAAHKGRHVSKYINTDNGGRPAKQSDEYAYSVFEKYLNCEFGTKRCKELLGYSEKTPLRERAQFVRYRKEHGIVDYKNNVDIIGVKAKSKLESGCIAGYIVYSDGTKKYIEREPENKEEEIVCLRDIDEEIKSMERISREAFSVLNSHVEKEKEWDPFAEVDRYAFSLG